MEDYAYVRSALCENLPELRNAIEALEDEQREFNSGYAGGEIFGVSIYALASQVFIDGALAPLLECKKPDSSLATRCCRAIESLLSGDREEVHQMVSIRITDYILGWHHWSKIEKYAGPALREEVERRKRYYTPPW